MLHDLIRIFVGLAVKIQIFRYPFPSLDISGNSLDSVVELEPFECAVLANPTASISSTPKYILSTS